MQLAGLVDDEQASVRCQTLSERKWRCWVLITCLSVVSSPCYPRPHRGAVAQLGERLLCKQEVDGSIPFSSTMQAIGAQPGAKGWRRRAGRCGREGKQGLPGLMTGIVG